MKKLPITLLLILCAPDIILAATPQSVFYEGYLTDPTGQPINETPGDDFYLTLNLYDSEDGTIPVWGPSTWCDETSPLCDQTIEVANGYFSLELDLTGIGFLPV